MASTTPQWNWIGKRECPRWVDHKLFGRHGVDGALSGGASLHANHFFAIVRDGIDNPYVEVK